MPQTKELEMYIDIGRSKVVTRMSLPYRGCLVSIINADDKPEMAVFDPDDNTLHLEYEMTGDGMKRCFDVIDRFNQKENGHG